MANWDPSTAVEYHERTKHSYESLRADRYTLDWRARPVPFKDYPGAERLPLPGSLDRLLRLGAGIVRTRALPGGGEYHFRTYSSAGALYPVEVYVATAEGLYSLDVRGPELVVLRRGDARSALAAAADAPELGEAAAVLVLTGILWRTAWKYRARGYRHLYWDAGTMLANLLAVAQSSVLDARVLTGFVDAEVNELLGVDGDREAALALAAFGHDAGAGAELGPLLVEAGHPAPGERAFPEAAALHAASSLADLDEVRRYRATPRPAGTAPPLELDELERVLRRRGSIRDFSPEPVPLATLAPILAGAAAPIPADFEPSNDAYLVVSAVEGLRAGTYRYEPPDDFQLLAEGNFRLQAGYLVLEQSLGALAAATVYFLAELEPLVERLGNRGYRAALLEAGIRTGRVYIGAFTAGLGATASTFYDDDVTRFLAPETNASPLLCAALGKRFT
jgi:SagB-type dehydrogenase family enzyme